MLEDISNNDIHDNDTSVTLISIKSHRLLIDFLLDSTGKLLEHKYYDCAYSCTSSNCCSPKVNKRHSWGTNKVNNWNNYYQLNTLYLDSVLIFKDSLNAHSFLNRSSSSPSLIRMLLKYSTNYKWDEKLNKLSIYVNQPTSILGIGLGDTYVNGDELKVKKIIYFFDKNRIKSIEYYLSDGFYAIEKFIYENGLLSKAIIQNFNERNELYQTFKYEIIYRKMKKSEF